MQCSWDEAKNLCPDLLTSFTFSALTAKTNAVHNILFLADMLDGQMVGLKRMVEDDGVSTGKPGLVLLHSHERMNGWKESRQSQGKS